MNLYGVNSLYNLLGFKVNPWSFGLPLLSSLLTGRNIPNIFELRKLRAELHNLDYYFIPSINNKHQTIFIDVAKYAPKFLKSIFQNKWVGWQLDLCIIPEKTQIEAIVDKHPFGDFDHSSLIVS